MARRQLSLHQQAALDEVTAFDMQLRQIKLTAEAEVRRQVNEKIAAAGAELDRLVRTAVDAGVPKEEFRRPEHGLHTKNRQTVLDILARTESLREAVEQVEVAAGPRVFAIDQDGYLVITPPSDEILVAVAHYRSSGNWEPEDVVPVSARFQVSDNGFMISVDPERFPETLSPNPIVAWAKKHKAEAVAWWEQHRP